MNAMKNSALNSTKVTGKRIAVVIYNYLLGVSPSVINSIAMLAQDNQVEVLTSLADENTPPPPSWLVKHIYTCEKKRSYTLFRLYRLLARFLYLIPTIKKYDRIIWRIANMDILWFSKWITKRHENMNVDIYILVEACSLIAFDISGIKDTSVIYYDMELLDWPSNKNQPRGQSALKELAHHALMRVDHVMITSPNRARAFAKINKFPNDHISVIPTVPTKGIGKQHSNYFREKFRIPEEKYIIIYSGNFEPWAQCVDIITNMYLWPENTVLIMHTWNKKSLHSGYFSEMSAAAAGFPVHFSSEFIPSGELTSALSSADIGLLFYDSIDENFTEILFSSNKMGEYLAANLPIICSPHPSLTEFTQAHEIGIACNFSEIGNSIEFILQRLDNYKKNVKSCLDRHFQFETYFEKAYKEFAENLSLNKDKNSLIEK